MFINKLILIIACTIGLNICCFGFNGMMVNTFANDSKYPEQGYHKACSFEKSRKNREKEENVHNASDMIKLVNKLKKEILKETLKEKLRMKIGKDVDAVADLIIDEALAKHKIKNDEKERYKKLEEQLKNIF